jgi:hypothetical protein
MAEVYLPKDTKLVSGSTEDLPVAVTAEPRSHGPIHSGSEVDGG